MKLLKGGPYVVLASAVVLVIGLGGATYAAAQITGADIKDGTVRSADIHDSTLRLRDFSDTAKAGLKGSKGAPGTPGETGPSDAYTTGKSADTIMTGTFAAVVTLTPPAGQYVASATGIVFEVSGASPAFGDCQLVVFGQASDTGQTAVTIPAGGQYATAAAQVTFTTDGTGVLTFMCEGTNAGINDVMLTAIKVGALHTS